MRNYRSHAGPTHLSLYFHDEREQGHSAASERVFKISLIWFNDWTLTAHDTFRLMNSLNENDHRYR